MKKEKDGKNPLHNQPEHIVNYRKTTVMGSESSCVLLIYEKVQHMVKGAFYYNLIVTFDTFKFIHLLSQSAFSLYLSM